MDAAYAPYIPLIGRPPAPMSEDYASRIAAGEAFVLDDGGAILGIAILIDQPPALMIDNIAIAPNAQGKGLGRAILAHAERTARDKGHKTLRLYTNVAMTRNIAIYRKAGFIETGRHQTDRFHRVDMEKQFLP